MKEKNTKKEKKEERTTIEERGTKECTDDLTALFVPCHNINRFGSHSGLNKKSVLNVFIY